ncbi:hypothetical protein AMECASPLE_032607 [Ameca splendens]|uniref:Ubiquitin-like protease family profile domain-containing protein n=1 Tax=Ameca splendens TaxID=208324 RepID=A0ABV0Z4K6_9TELE
MGCNISRWTCDTLKHPKQADATSCGLFTLKAGIQYIYYLQGTWMNRKLKCHLCKEIEYCFLKRIAYLFQFAETILKENISFLTTKKARIQHRMKIATTLLLNTDDLSSLCHYCGEKDSDTEDI